MSPALRVRARTYRARGVRLLTLWPSWICWSSVFWSSRVTSGKWLPDIVPGRRSNRSRVGEAEHGEPPASCDAGPPHPREGVHIARAHKTSLA